MKSAAVGFLCRTVAYEVWGTRAVEVLRTSPTLARSVGTPFRRKGVRHRNGAVSATVPRTNRQNSVSSIFKPLQLFNNMVKLYVEIEEHIQEALGSIPHDKEVSVPKLETLAQEFHVPMRRLQNHFQRTPSRNAQIPANRRLSPAEELAICDYIDRLDQLGLCVRPPILRNCANVILSRSYEADDDSPPTVGPRWTSRFLAHHPKYSVRKQQITDPKRKVANDAKSIEEWYKNFHFTYLKYGIQSSDCWNMDESGFQIGMGKNQKVITTDIR